jgi:hypothetical protein
METIDLKDGERTNPDEITESAAFLYALVENLITRADTKAGLILAADTVFATVLIVLSKGAIVNLLDSSTNFASRFSGLLAILTFAALLLSSLFVLLVARPKLLSGKEEASGSLFFFGRISQMRYQDFVEQFSKQSSAELRNTLLTEVHTTAQLANQKFNRIRYSLDFLIVAVILWTIMQIVVALSP